jgi:hypothetical protein
MSGLRRMMGAATLWPVALLASALLVAALVAPHAAPARAAQGGVFVQVDPNTIQAGYQVEIHASCGEGLNPATVRSGAFGEITLTPYLGSRFLFGSTTVPADTRAGEYDVDLRCANGGRASTELFVLGMARPTRGPDTGGGGTAGADGGPAVPAPLMFGGVGAAAFAAGVGLLLARRRSTA